MQSFPTRSDGLIAARRRCRASAQAERLAECAGGPQKIVGGGDLRHRFVGNRIAAQPVDVVQDDPAAVGLDPRLPQQAKGVREVLPPAADLPGEQALLDRQAEFRAIPWSLVIPWSMNRPPPSGRRASMAFEGLRPTTEERGAVREVRPGSSIASSMAGSPAGVHAYDAASEGAHRIWLVLLVVRTTPPSAPGPDAKPQARKGPAVCRQACETLPCQVGTAADRPSGRTAALAPTRRPHVARQFPA